MSDKAVKQNVGLSKTFGVVGVLGTWIALGGVVNAYKSSQATASTNQEGVFLGFTKLDAKKEATILGLVGTGLAVTALIGSALL